MFGTSVKMLLGILLHKSECQGLSPAPLLTPASYKGTPREQEVMAEALEPSLTWETLIEFLALHFSLAQLQM